MVSNRLEQYGRQVSEGVAKEVMLAAYDIHQEAVQRSRVDTGALRGSWRTEHPRPGVAIVASDQEHAIYNEFGTRHMAAQPMLQPAVKRVLPKVAERVARLLKEKP